jgi:hypothetical protein
MVPTHKCPKCGALCPAPATLLFVCKDPDLQKHLPIIPAKLSKSQSEWPVQLYRCPKCGHGEMHDPSFDIPDPMG